MALVGYCVYKYIHKSYGNKRSENVWENEAVLKTQISTESNIHS